MTRMSSAENGRLVWITEEQIAWLEHFRRPTGNAIVNAYAAAPADPAEAVTLALASVECPENEATVVAVLAALGMPQRPTPRDEAPS